MVVEQNIKVDFQNVYFCFFFHFFFRKCLRFFGRTMNYQETSNPSFFLVGSFPGHACEMTVADSIDLRFAELERIGFGDEFREQLLRPRGIEPPRGCPHWHLKPARLPVPPRPLFECAFGPDFRLPGIAGRVSVSGGPAESSGSRNARWTRARNTSPTGSRYGSSQDPTGPGVINSPGVDDGGSQCQSRPRFGIHRDL